MNMNDILEAVILGGGSDDDIEDAILFEILNEEVCRPVKKTRRNKRVVLRRNAMEYLTQKSARDQEIRLKKMQLQEEKHKLEMRKLQNEIERLEMELEYRKKLNELEYEKLKLGVRQRTDLQAQMSSQKK